MAQPPQTWTPQQRDPVWVAQTLLPGPNGRRFDGAGLEAFTSVVPTGVVTMYDSIRPSLMPKGAPAYAGYADGTYADMSTVEALFPGATYVSIAIAPTTRAMYIDIEPGNYTASAVPGFIKAGGMGFYASPGAGSGYSVQDCLDACSAAGIARPKVWSAHWIGRHICGPATCGYPQADGTQYVATLAWDESVVTAPGFFELQVFPLLPGAIGQQVVVLQKMINKWIKALGIPLELDPDGVFGPVTEAAVQAALVYWHYNAAAVAAGEVDRSLWNHLAASPPPPPPPPPTIPAWQVDIYDKLPDVREGASDTSGHVPWVTQVQLLASIAGPVPCTPDGFYGPKTKASVLAVQQAHDIPVRTGDVDGYTWQVLLARSLGGILPEVAQGNTDPLWVRRVQALCDAHGVSTAIDGVYGPGTKSSVQAVQHQYLSYDQADGVVGPVTWHCLAVHAHP